MASRRSYGTGRLYVRTDRNGRETWYGKWHVNGRRVNRKVGPKRVNGSREGMTQTQAEAVLRRLIREVSPAATIVDRLSVGEVGALYVADLERKGRKPETVRAAECAIRVHFAPFFGDRAIHTIRQEDISALALHMTQTGARSRKQGLKPKSIRNYLGTLSALFQFARRRGLMHENPVSLMELPTVPDDDDIRFLTPAEVRVLVDAIAPGPYWEIDRTYFLTAAMTGLRLGELRALRWRDIDWTAARVRVRRNYVRGRYGTPKTKRSTRSVPLAREVARALDRLRRAVSPASDGTLVFNDPVESGPLDDNEIRSRFAQALTTAELPKHTPHDLRHTFGTAMAAAGVPMRMLQEWMGHRDIATTQRYADYAPSHDEAALVDAAFGSQGPVQGPDSSEFEGTSEHRDPDASGDLT
jgi:integrase